MQSPEKKILSRIYGKKRGWVFTPTHLYDLGSRGAVSMALTRLVKRGVIRRIGRGLYDYPKKHPVLGDLSPAPEAIAKALAGKYQIRLMPTGAQATNMLHLSDQVPARVVYLTEGDSRTVKVGNQVIELRHVAPSKMAAADKISGLVIEALRYLGKKHLTQTHISQLHDMLSNDDKKQVIKDISLAPTWMHDYLRDIANLGGE